MRKFVRILAIKTSGLSGYNWSSQHPTVVPLPLRPQAAFWRSRSSKSRFSIGNYWGLSEKTHVDDHPQTGDSETVKLWESIRGYDVYDSFMIPFKFHDTHLVQACVAKS